MYGFQEWFGENITEFGSFMWRIIIDIPAAYQPPFPDYTEKLGRR